MLRRWDTRNLLHHQYNSFRFFWSIYDYFLYDRLWITVVAATRLVVEWWKSVAFRFWNLPFNSFFTKFIFLDNYCTTSCVLWRVVATLVMRTPAVVLKTTHVGTTSFDLVSSTKINTKGNNFLRSLSGTCVLCNCPSRDPKAQAGVDQDHTWMMMLMLTLLIFKFEHLFA